MKIIWLGHGSFRIETGDRVLLIDPWLTGNPMLPEDRHDAATRGATHILLTHAHFDHVADVLPLARRLKVPVVGQYDLMAHWEEHEGIETIGFNKGGTVDLGGVSASMVRAEHSSSFASPEGPKAAGSEVGYMIAAEGHVIYHSGDTDIMADMGWFGEYYKPDIGILDEAFLAEVRNLPERNLAVEMLERLLEGEIKSRFSGNVVQEKKFSEMLSNVVKRYQNRSIETAQVIEELIEMARKFHAAANRGEELGLTEDEIRFYDALANNESAVRELNDETLKKIAHELTENLRKNITVDWSARASIRAKLRIMVKRILKKYKYPPDQQEGAVELVLKQAEALGEAWG